jgi:hypothetical protein
MESRQVQIKLDLGKLKEFSVLGIRRAAAFLGVGINSTESWQNPSLVLDGELRWQFFPDALSEARLKEVVEEFRVWIIGNAMRELDANFNIFLDEAWQAKEWMKLHNSRVPSNHAVRSIAGGTNAANKFEKLLRDIGGDQGNVERLKTLSNFRNCLTHGRGVVGPRYINSNGKMIIKWLAFDVIIKDNSTNQEITMESAIVGQKVFKDGAEVYLKVCERNREFELNSQAFLSPKDLHELCFFYLQITDQAVGALREYLEGLGIEVTPVKLSGEGA